MTWDLLIIDIFHCPRLFANGDLHGFLSFLERPPKSTIFQYTGESFRRTQGSIPGLACQEPITMRKGV
jgi:hypothetical protein